MAFADLQNFSTPPKRICGAPMGSILFAFPTKPIAPHDRLGYSFRSEPCTSVSDYSPDVCVPVSGFPKMTPEEFGPEKEAQLNVIQSAFKCSTVGATDEELRRYAREAIEINLWREVEDSLEVILLAEASPIGGPFDPLCALAGAGQELAENSHCGTGVIYGPISWFIRLGADYITKNAGENFYRDFLGNIVIPSSIDSDTVYFFDSEVETRISEVQLLDEYAPGIRTVNDRVVRAEMVYTVAIDACFVGSITLDPCAAV